MFRKTSRVHNKSLKPDTGQLLAPDYNAIKMKVMKNAQRFSYEPRVMTSYQQEGERDEPEQLINPTRQERRRRQTQQAAMRANDVKVESCTSLASLQTPELKIEEREEQHLATRDVGCSPDKEIWGAYIQNIQTAKSHDVPRQQHTSHTAHRGKQRAWTKLHSPDQSGDEALDSLHDVSERSNIDDDHSSSSVATEKDEDDIYASEFQDAKKRKQRDSILAALQYKSEMSQLAHDIKRAHNSGVACYILGNDPTHAISRDQIYHLFFNKWQEHTQIRKMSDTK